MAWGESKSDVHERGRQDGLNSDWWEQTAETWSSPLRTTEEDEVYHKGFEEGVRQQKD